MSKTKLGFIGNHDTNISMEAEETSGVKFKEREYVFYARLKDVHILTSSNIAKEFHEQWSIKLNKEGMKAQIRVRKTTDVTGISYAQTIKIRNDTDQSTHGVEDDSVALECSKDAFEAIRKLADSGMVKERYYLPLSNVDLPKQLFWEIDLFPTPDNSTYYDWVKIDLELPSDLVLKTIPKLPSVFTEIIMEQGDKTPENDRLIITQLYENVFLRKKWESD